MHKIYALFDYNLFISKDISIREFIDICNKNDVCIIQYRDKISSLSKMKEIIKELKKYWKKPLIINDKIELISYCDGLHLGQEDIREFDKNLQKAAKIVREKIGDKILGLSTHNKEEVLEANMLPLDYIGLGAYKKTATKQTDNILGDEIENIASYSSHPVAAIGGVKLDDKIKNITYLVIGSNLYDY